MASEDLPDLLFMDNPDMAFYACEGNLANIQDLLKDWKDQVQFYEKPWRTVSDQNGVYGIPLGVNSLALFYNKDMFASAAIPVPTNWDEFLTAARKLTHGKVKGFGYSGISTEEGTYQFLPWLYSAGGDVDHLGSIEGNQAFGIISQLVQSGSMSKDVINWTQADVMKQFAAGNIAMMVNGPWQLPELAAISPNLRYGVAEIPRNKTYASVLGGEDLAVVKGDHVPEAVEFLKYVGSAEVLKSFIQGFGYFPARKDLVREREWTEDPRMKVFAKTLDYSQVRGPDPAWPALSKVISEEAVKVVTLNRTPEEAAKEASEAIQAIRKQP